MKKGEKEWITALHKDTDDSHRHTVEYDNKDLKRTYNYLCTQDGRGGNTCTGTLGNFLAKWLHSIHIW